MVEISVRQVYFDAISRGTKTIEGRLAKEKYRALKPGGLIRFHNDAHTQFVDKRVVAVHVYPTFESAFQEQDYQDAIPDAKSAEDAARVYEQFYSKEAQQKHGVVFIELNS